MIMEEKVVQVTYICILFPLLFDLPSLLYQDALQQRLAVQEDAVLQLKQELLRCSMAKDQLEGENVRQMMISFLT